MIAGPRRDLSSCLEAKPGGPRDSLLVHHGSDRSVPGRFRGPCLPAPAPWHARPAQTGHARSQQGGFPDTRESRPFLQPRSPDRSRSRREAERRPRPAEVGTSIQASRTAVSGMIGLTRVPRCRETRLQMTNVRSQGTRPRRGRQGRWCRARSGARGPTGLTRPSRAPRDRTRCG